MTDPGDELTPAALARADQLTTGAVTLARSVVAWHRALIEGGIPTDTALNMTITYHDWLLNLHNEELVVSVDLDDDE